MKFVWVCHGNEVSRLLFFVSFIFFPSFLSLYSQEHQSWATVMETLWEKYKVRAWKESVRSVRVEPSEVSIRDHKWKEALSHFKEEIASPRPFTARFTADGSSTDSFDL